MIITSPTTQIFFMKNLFFIPLLFFYALSFAQTAKTDTDLINQANTTIRDVSTPGGVTRAAVATMHKDVVASKISRELARNRQTDNYTLALTDNFKFVEVNAATAKVITVPADATVAFPVDNTQITIARYGAGTVTVAAAGGVTIRSADGALGLRVQYSSAVLIKIGTNEWYLIGDLQ